ncbi:protein SLX4IP isoform X2 [Salmo salar]|nr:protein SLX4IP isoform X2 [Salmo salar]
MAPHKVVVKCGSYAVLLDLQIIGPLGRGSPQETSWFTMEHTEEVTSLVRDAVDRRVRLYIDCLHKRGQPKHKRELPHANPLCVKGRRVSLVANFVKRHFNLRCIVKQQYGELRVFPERYVVCVSRLEDVSANPTPAVTVTVSQSTESQYFSRPAAETRDELNSSTITKRSSLQKIARHANARPQPETQLLPYGSILGKKLHSEQNRVPGEQGAEPQPPTGQPSLTAEAVLPHGHPTTSTDPTVQAGAVGGVGLTEGQQRESVGLPGNTDPRETVLSQSQFQGGEDKPSRVPGEDPPGAKRVCLGPPLVACSSNELIIPTHSAVSSNPLPPPSLSSPRPPLVKSSAKTESKAFPSPAPAAALFPAPMLYTPASSPAPEKDQSTAPSSLSFLPYPASSPAPEKDQSTATLSSLPAPALSPVPTPERTQSQTSQTAVEVELLTPGKQSQSLLPLTSSNNTEQTNQNSPAAGLRGRSVKDVVSSALSIASTHTGVIGEGEEGRENGGRRRRGEEKRGKIMEGKRGVEREYNGGKESRRGEEREVGEEERENVTRPSRLRRLKK